MGDFIVKIEYKNDAMETVVEKEYSFPEYTEMLRLNLLRVIGDVEEAFYSFSGYKRKEDWDPDLLEKFKRIRHKMLDEANDIMRLPQTLYYKGVRADSIPLSEFLKRQLER